MKTSVMYSQKIKHYNHSFRATVDAYRAAVDFFISVCMEEWDSLSTLPASKTLTPSQNTLSKLTLAHRGSWYTGMI